MSKILFFAGREHHVHKMLPVLLGLKERGHDATFVTAANSINLDPNTELLEQFKLPYLYADSYLEASDVERIDNNTTEVLGRLKSYGQWLPPFWIAQGVREQVQIQAAWHNMLAKEQPACVVCLHGVNFWTNSLSYLSQDVGIPVVTFQEGRLRHLDQKTQGKQAQATKFSSKVLVWSEATKAAYIEAGTPESKLAVTGPVHLDSWIIARQRPDFEPTIRASFGLPPTGKIVTFAPPQLNRYQGDISEAIKRLYAWADSMHIIFIVKLHPFTPESVVTELQKLAGPSPFVVLLKQEATPILAISDVVCTQHSTVGVEALSFGMPLVEIDFEGYGVLESLVSEGVAFNIGEPKQIDLLTDILNGKLVQDKEKVSKWVADNVGNLDGMATARACNEIEGLCH